MEGLAVRNAVSGDLPAINAIYNHYVATSTCTFQEESESEEARAAWFRQHGGLYPVIVAEAAGEVVGWASLSPFHTRCAYRFTVEPSVYVRHDWQEHGVGRALMAELIARARAAGHHSLVGAVCAENTASLRLGQGFGFAEVGRLREVGFKFGRWLDVIYVQLTL